MAGLKEKIQNGLDETRILVLGAQVLIGFQMRAVFEKGFEKLPEDTQALMVAGLGSMLAAFALLILPTAYHIIVKDGEDSRDFHAFISRVAAPALLPFAIGLGISLFAAGEMTTGRPAGIGIGAAGAAAALWFWYGMEWRDKVRPHAANDAHTGHGPPREHAAREEKGEMSGVNVPTDETQKTSDRVKHVLTETRVVLPGAQALIGFQFATFLMEGFDKLPQSAKLTHLAALGLVSLSTILLMMPASYHRIVEEGESTEHFCRFTSRALLAAMAILALGISADLYVVLLKVTRDDGTAVIGSLVSLVMFYGLWFVYTAAKRAQERGNATPGSWPAGRRIDSDREG